jgi:hypothetical protein
MCNTRGLEYRGVPKLKMSTNNHIIHYIIVNTLYNILFSHILKIFLHHLKISWVVLTLFEESTNLRNIVPFRQDKRKFVKVMFLWFVHPSLTMVHPNSSHDERNSTSIRLISSIVSNNKFVLRVSNVGALNPKIT